MLPAPLPPHDDERLEALHAYAVLDTDAEEHFDELVQLTARICEVPICLISLIDENRQWFKAKVGIDACETGRDISFCGHAILQDELFVVEDALADERFADNPFVTQPPHIRFYAGMPLINPAGFKLGTLCVISPTPGRLTEHQAASMRTIAHQVTSLLELRLTMRRLHSESQRVALAKSQAEAASQAKSTFLANISHEIRTPLTSVIGFADQLVQSPPEDPAEAARWAATIAGSGRHLLSLINDVLDLSKIEAGKVEYESLAVDVRELLEQTLVTFEPQAAERKLTLGMSVDPDVPAGLLTDPVRLRQSVTNLVGNAMKFTETGSVCVQVSHASDRLTIEVTDTGCGMTDAVCRRIFAPFSQADASTTRRFGGTGLGLTITRNLAEGMGGSLTCRSTPGQGSTFTLTVNAPATNLASRPANPVATTGENTPMSGRVLVVDDAAPNRKLLSLLLTRAGIEVDTAEDGYHALELAKKQSYDLVLMDLQMPGIDGYTTARRLRDDGLPCPILALTASAPSEVEAPCSAAGMTECLTKPIDRTALFASLARHLTATPLAA